MNVPGGTPVAPVRTEELACWAPVLLECRLQSKNRNSKDMKKVRKVQAYLAAGESFLRTRHRPSQRSRSAEKMKGFKLQARFLATGQKYSVFKRCWSS